MANLEHRVAALEVTRSTENLKSMTDEELGAHIRSLETGSQQFFSAVIAKILRHPSDLPIVNDDPDWTEQ